MARKPLKKRQWSCKYKCKRTSIPCEHLEEKLPKEVIEPLIYSNKLEYLQQHQSQKYSDLIYTCDEETIDLFIAKLKSFGMKPFQIELIMDRFVHDLTFQEILKKSHWTSMGTLFRTFRKCLSLLKERGLTPPKRVG
jgi:hypothetical protein